MATINLGAIKFNWNGAYNNSTAYAVDDVVSSGGSSYVCILASQGNAVSNGTYWNQMSAAGTNGTNGTDVGTVITTQGDILYRDGSGLQRLPKGTANQELRINSGATAPEWFTPAGAGLDSLHVYNNSSGTVTANTVTQWTGWSTPHKNDFGSAWNSTNGNFTIPTTGSYFVHCYMGFGHNGNSTRYHAGRMYIDGSHPAASAQGYISTMTRMTSNGIQDSGYDFVSGIVTLNANQVLTFYIWLNDEGAGSDNHLAEARLSIMKL